MKTRLIKLNQSGQFIYTCSTSIMKNKTCIIFSGQLGNSCNLEMKYHWVFTMLKNVTEAIQMHSIPIYNYTENGVCIISFLNSIE